jgi:hypothetical protein
MWSIEISENASDEEIREALLEAIDFNYIRKNVTELGNLVNEYGPFREIAEKDEESPTEEIVRTYHDRRGWICDDLSNIDSRVVWTNLLDPFNGYSYMVSGYQFVGERDTPSRHEIQSWFISNRLYIGENMYLHTDYHLSVSYNDSDGDYFPEIKLRLWDLVDAPDLSDQALVAAIGIWYY